MHLVCPACSQEVTGQDVNFQAAVARCPKCFAFFAAKPSRRRSADAREPIRPQVSQPWQLEMDESGCELMIWFRWLRWELILLVVLTLVWTFFYVVLSFMFLTMVFSQRNGDGMTMSIGTGIFLVGGLAFSVALGYTSLLGLLNSTTLELKDDRLLVRHGPFPWFGNIELPTKRIRQLYCALRLPWTGTSFSLRETGATYELIAILDDGAEVSLCVGLTDPSSVWFMEQKLEKRLLIQDQRLPSEYLGE